MMVGSIRRITDSLNITSFPKLVAFLPHMLLFNATLRSTTHLVIGLNRASLNALGLDVEGFEYACSCAKRHPLSYERASRG